MSDVSAAQDAMRFYRACRARGSDGEAGFVGMKMIKWILVACILLAAAGCTIHAPATSGAGVKPPSESGPQALSQTKVKPSVTLPASTARFYFFMRAQLYRKRGEFDQAIAYLRKALAADPQSDYIRQELAHMLMRHQETDQALELTREVLAKNPKNIEALITYAGIQEARKNFTEARKTYEKVIAADPQRKNVYIHLASLYREAGDNDRAMQVYQKLIKHFPGAYVGYFFIGKIYSEQGKGQLAVKAFKKTLELAPDLEEPRFEILNIYRKAKRTKDVLALYKEILARNSDSIRAAMGLGLYNAEIGRNEQAARIFKDLGKRSQVDAKVIARLVRIYVDTKDYTSAMTILTGMLAAAPQRAELHYVAGVVCEAQKKNAAAISHFGQIKTNSKFYQTAVQHMVYLYQREHRNAEALKTVRDAILQQPENAEFYLYMGTIHEQAKDYKKAEAALKQGLDKDPENARFYFRLGVVYDKWGRRADSIAAIKNAIRLDSKNASSLNYLGYTYADMGIHLDEAERLIRQALKYKPNDGYIIDSLGWVFYKKGRFQEALKYLKSAASLVSDDPTILEHLGDVYRKLNQRDKALKYYRRSILKKKKDKAKIEIKIRDLIEKSKP